MDKLGTMTALVVGALVIGGLVWSAEKGKQKGTEQEQMVAMAMGATVPIDQAIHIALENYPGRVIEAELERSGDKTVWEIEIVTAEQRIMTVLIDAESASVIDTEEKPAGQKFEQESKKGRMGTEQR